MIRIILSVILLFISSNTFAQQMNTTNSENATIRSSEKKSIDAKQTETTLKIQRKADTPELKKFDKKDVPRSNAETPELKKYSTTSQKRTSAKPVLLVKQKKRKKDKN